MIGGYISKGSTSLSTDRVALPKSNLTELTRWFIWNWPIEVPTPSSMLEIKYTNNQKLSQLYKIDTCNVWRLLSVTEKWFDEIDSMILFKSTDRSANVFANTQNYMA